MATIRVLNPLCNVRLFTPPRAERRSSLSSITIFLPSTYQAAAAEAGPRVFIFLQGAAMISAATPLMSVGLRKAVLAPVKACFLPPSTYVRGVAEVRPPPGS